jgi:hypothetical protein
MVTDIQPANKTIRVDSHYIVDQFARITVTLEHLKDAMDSQSRREDAQDDHIEALRADISEIKADVRSLKEAKPQKVSPFVAVTAIVAASGFALSLLNQLYGATP